VLAEVYDGPGAVEAGFLDLVAPVERVGDVAIEAAARLAELHLGAHHATKRRVRKATLAVLRKSLDEDLSDIGQVNR
jgi:enoyl-CoA hydratase